MFKELRGLIRTSLQEIYTAMKGAISTVSTDQALAAATTADEVLEAHGF